MTLWKSLILAPTPPMIPTTYLWDTLPDTGCVVASGNLGSSPPPLQWSLQPICETLYLILGVLLPLEFLDPRPYPSNDGFQLLLSVSIQIFPKQLHLLMRESHSFIRSRTRRGIISIHRFLCVTLTHQKDIANMGQCFNFWLIEWFTMLFKI